MATSIQLQRRALVRRKSPKKAFYILGKATTGPGVSQIGKKIDISPASDKPRKTETTKRRSILSTGLYTQAIFCASLLACLLPGSRMSVELKPISTPVVEPIVSQMVDSQSTPHDSSAGDFEAQSSKMEKIQTSRSFAEVSGASLGAKKKKYALFIFLLLMNSTPAASRSFFDILFVNKPESVPPLDNKQEGLIVARAHIVCTLCLFITCSYQRSQGKGTSSTDLDTLVKKTQTKGFSGKNTIRNGVYSILKCLRNPFLIF